MSGVVFISFALCLIRNWLWRQSNCLIFIGLPTPKYLKSGYLDWFQFVNWTCNTLRIIRELTLLLEKQLELYPTYEIELWASCFLCQISSSRIDLQKLVRAGERDPKNVKKFYFLILINLSSVKTSLPLTKYAT